MHHSPRSTRRSYFPILGEPLVRAIALCAAFALHACGGGGGGGGGGGAGGSASLAGTISVPGTSGPIVEAEPNDAIDQVHFLGSLIAGQTLVVSGQVSPGDPIDGFRVDAPSRVRVSATLSFDDSNGEDFDIGIYDAIAGDYVTVFATSIEPESGTFHAKGTFFPVVAQFAGDGAYTLTLVASAAANPIAEVELNDASGEAMYLGGVIDADTLRVSGNANALTDATDRFLIAVGEDVDLAATLSHPGGANFDVLYADATADILNPTPIAAFDSPTAHPEVGSAAIAALTLVEVTVRATSGSGNYTLRLDAAAPFAPGAIVRHWRIAPLENERRARFAREGRTAFGAAQLPSIAGEVLVLPDEAASLNGALARRGLTERSRIPGGARCVVAALPVVLAPHQALRHTQALIASLATAPGVVYAEPNRLRGAYDVPNDPYYNLQWHYPLIHLPAAWDLTVGSNNVRVAVIDTGETAHPDLVARQVAGFDFISSLAIAGDGDGIDPDPTDVGDGQGAQPSSYHGTHVAGTIGASSDDNRGVAGVTWAGEIMHLRVLGIGGGSDFDIANAVLYAAQLANNSGQLPPVKSDVINMSLGGAGSTQTMQNAVTAAFNAGVVVFAAAGNENSPTPSYPASYDNVISVAAVDFNAMRAPYSNFNNRVDLAAPGGDVSKDLNGDGYGDGVLSTLMDDSTTPIQPIYAFYQGTSMACPHAAGVAALMLALTPALTPAQVESFLTSTATDLGAVGRDDVYGHGLINAYQAVLQSSAGAPVNPVLGLSSQSASFGPTTPSVIVQVSNLGGGLLDVQTPVVSTESGGVWLFASLIPVSVPTTTDTSAIAITVNRAGLADGVYVGTVDVPSNGGSAIVQVSLQVDSTPTPPNVVIYVLAVDSASGASVFQDIVNPAGNLAYTLPTLPAGDYWIIAGSDDNDDGFICGPGDVYSGAYPTFAEPVAISVIDGQSVAGLDFTVGTGLGGLGAGVGAPRWKRLR